MFIGHNLQGTRKRALYAIRGFKNKRYLLNQIKYRLDKIKTEYPPVVAWELMELLAKSMKEDLQKK